LKYEYILVMKFVNRKKELGFLQRKYGSKEAELIVLYGRRRIGKTELLNAFAEGKPTIYFLGRLESKEDTLRRINLLLMETFKDVSLARTQLHRWDDILEYIAKKSKPRLILIIDEFPFVVEKFPELPSTIQDKWDNALKKTEIMLVLCGSSIRMMEKYALDYNGPIYGRRTGQWKVEKLDIIHFKELFPHYSLQDILTVYAVIDTIPGYLAKFDGSLTAWENIEKKMLTKGEFLYEEVEILLREEFRDASNYMSILSAIAGGLSSFNEIYSKTGLDKSLLSKYLFTLDNLGITEKSLPITDSFKEKLKAKGALYSIRDNFFDFWFRFVYPSRPELERARAGEVAGTIKKEFPEYLGKKFEQFSMEILPHLGIFSFTRTGRWWHKEKEIDIVALNEPEKKILFCECKWQENADARRILNELKEKAKSVQWHNKERKEHYAIFAKSFKRKRKEPGVFMFDQKDMEKALKQKSREQR